MSKNIYIGMLLVYELILSSLLLVVPDNKVISLLVGMCPIAICIIGAIAK